MTNPSDQQLLEAHLDNQLNTEQREFFEARCAADPELAAERRAAEQLHRGLTKLEQEAFTPFFSTRVMNRIAGLDTVSRAVGSELLWRLFPAVSGPAALAAVLVMIGNANSATPNSTWVEAIFAIPTDTETVTFLNLGGAQ